MGKTKTKIYPGLRFGRLTLIKKQINENGKQLGWICSCDCGNIKLIKNIGTLVNGTSSSCGCFKDEFFKINNPMFKPDIQQKMSNIMKSKPEQMENIKKAVAAAQTPESKEKRRATNLSKYGNINPPSNQNVKNKIK